MVFLEEKEKRVMRESRESPEGEGLLVTTEPRACGVILEILELTTA